MKLNYHVSLNFTIENPDFYPTEDVIAETIADLLEDQIGIIVEEISVEKLT